MKVKVSTLEYEWAWDLHKPRGEGGWMFYMSNDPRTVIWPSESEFIYKAPFGSYSKAKRRAVSEARKRGFGFVRVAS